MAFVLDCSVAASWFFRDERNPYAMAAQERLEHEPAVVPCHFFLEVANVLLVGERRASLTRREGDDLLRLLDGLPITTDTSFDKTYIGSVRALAREHHLSAYEATYLELAQRTGLPLATLDDGLRCAAGEADVAVWRPD
ncbi:type II toxin-antitoxin system VapC family toxin [bacterium]|nr:type II toxin-antitoxin system VapC family toxin [bacterium]